MWNYKFIKSSLYTVVFLVGLWHSNLNAEPIASVEFEESRCYVGSPFIIEYHVAWQGDPGNFAVLPIEVPEISWGEIEYGSAKSYQDNNEWVVLQQLVVKPHSEGEFVFPEVRIGYVTANEFPEESAILDDVLEHNTYVLVVEGMNIVVVQPVSAWIIALPIVGVLVFGIAFALLVWWRSSTTMSLPPVSQQQKALQDFHQAQRLRLDGDYYAMYLLLSRIVGDFGNQTEDALLINRLKETTQAVGFQGIRPSEDEISGDMRDVERLVTQLKEEPSR